MARVCQSSSGKSHFSPKSGSTFSGGQPISSFVARCLADAAFPDLHHEIAGRNNREHEHRANDPSPLDWLSHLGPALLPPCPAAHHARR
jgi:hypothetical protein